ncbi:MAG: hypothetical protein VYC17_04485 [Nitrospinota bacterium]|nr:hypothetical protein [Nitrospinota bacterium]
MERKILSVGANIPCKLFFRIKGVNTYSPFYRAYSFKALQVIYERFGENIITEKGYICMVEMLLKLYRQGLSFAEVPTTPLSDQRIGFSKLMKKETIKAYLKLFFRNLVDKNP